MKTCRICLSNKNRLCPLFRSGNLTGNYAEMLITIADVKVASDDGLPDKICQKCCVALEKAYLLKCIAERTDRQLRKKLLKIQQSIPKKKISFNSIADVKEDILPLTIKKEPAWELAIDLDSSKKVDSIEGKDIVIANTVIRKVEPGSEKESRPRTNNPDLVWKKSNSDNCDAEFLDDDIFQDDDDEDYIPSLSESKTKRKPKSADIMVYREIDGKVLRRAVKVIRRERKSNGGTVTAIKVHPGKTGLFNDPTMKNGARGVPTFLKVKDGTIRKPSKYSMKASPTVKVKVRRPEKTERGSMKQKEKSVCPVCGILTYTLKAHMFTHEDPVMKNGARGVPTFLKVKDGTIRKPSKYSVKASPTVKVKVRRAEKTERGSMKQKEKSVCPVCGILTYSLKVHMFTHEEKKYTCDECAKSFSRKFSLILHMKNHIGIKDNICDECGAGYCNRKSLLRHKQVHKGPYPCHLCNKMFISIQTRKLHMRSHQGDRRFTCDYCNKGFLQSHHLRNHLLVHTGEKPFSCEMCEVAFGYKVQLNNHVYKAHGVNIRFKRIYTVTEEILRQEMDMANETRLAILQITPQQTDVPAPGAHETVKEEDSDTEYSD